MVGLAGSARLSILGFHEFVYRLVEDLGRVKIRTYISRSGLLSKIIESSGRLEEVIRVLKPRGYYNQPLHIILQAPPGMGKTYLAAVLLESVRKRRKALGLEVCIAYYLAPYKTIVDEIASDLSKISDFDPARGCKEPVYIIYQSPNDCQFALRRAREFIERYGSPTIACNVCPLRSEVGGRNWRQKLASLVQKVLNVDGPYRGAPVIEAIPRKGDRPCLRHVAARLALTLPALRSMRGSGVAGLLATYPALVNPTYLVTWAGMRVSQTPKLLILDEVDELLLRDDFDTIVLPRDLYPSEKHLLARLGLLNWYYELLEKIEYIATRESEEFYGDLVRMLHEHLVKIDRRVVLRLCKDCRDVVIERMEYCRLCIPLTTLLMIRSLLDKAVEEGCPIYEWDIRISPRPECVFKMVFFRGSVGENEVHLHVRPVGLVTRLLVDPFYPAYNHKLLMSATLDYVTRMAEEEGIEDRIGTGETQGFTDGLYSLSLYVDVHNKYSGLTLLLLEESSDLINALRLYEMNANALSLGLAGLMGLDNLDSKPHGLEYYIIKYAPCMVYALVEVAREHVKGGRGGLLVFTNSKENARELANTLVSMLSKMGVGVGKRVYTDYIDLVLKDFVVSITWYRSRVSRGVSIFKAYTASGCLMYARDPITTSSEVAARYRMAATTVQSLFRVVRSPVAKGKYIIMPRIVYDFIARNGPRWFQHAFDNIETINTDEVCSEVATYLS